MSDADFLNWLKERIVNVYREDKNMDFVMRLERIVANLEKITKGS